MAQTRISSKFTADTGGLVAGTKRAASAFERLAAQTSRLQRSMSTLVVINGAQLFGSVVSYAGRGVRSMLQLGQATADTIDKMSKLAFSTGTTYAEFAGLSYAGDLAGVAVEELATALNRADKVFVNAQSGSRSAQDAFKAIGLSVDDLATKSSAERFEAIASAIMSLPDPAQRTAAAMAIFGRAGANLLPMMAQGAEGIRQAREEFERFGGALSDTQATNVEAMNDAWTRVQAAISGVVTQVVANLAPAVQKVYDTISDMIAASGGASIGQFITEAFFTAAETLAAGADYLWENLKSGWEYASSVIEHFGGVTTVFSGVSNALASVFYVGEAALKGIAAVLARSAAGWAVVLDALPDAVAGTGWAEFGASMEESADRLTREADKAAANAISSGWAAVAGEAANAFEGSLERPAGTLQGIIQALRQTAIDAANTTTAAAADTVKAAGAEAAEQIASAKRTVSAVDARSTAGVNQIVQAINGADTREQIRLGRQQLAYLAQIARNDNRGLELAVAEI